MPTTPEPDRKRGPDSSYIDTVLSRLSEIKTEQEKFHFLELAAGHAFSEDSGPIYRQIVGIALSVLSRGHPSEIEAWFKEAESCYGGLPVHQHKANLNHFAPMIYEVKLQGSDPPVSTTCLPEHLEITLESMRRNQISICSRKLWVLSVKLRRVLR